MKDTGCVGSNPASGTIQLIVFWHRGGIGSMSYAEYSNQVPYEEYQAMNDDANQTIIDTAWQLYCNLGCWMIDRSSILKGIEAMLSA